MRAPGAVPQRSRRSLSRGKPLISRTQRLSLSSQAVPRSRRGALNFPLKRLPADEAKFLIRMAVADCDARVRIARLCLRSGRLTAGRHATASSRGGRGRATRLGLELRVRRPNPWLARCRGPRPRDRDSAQSQLSRRRERRPRAVSVHHRSCAVPVDDPTRASRACRSRGTARSLSATTIW